MNILEKQTKLLINKFRNGSQYNLKYSDIKQLVDTILQFEEVSEKNATPIVKIAKSFSIKVFKKNLDDDINSHIYLNGNTEEIYKVKKVIIVDKKQSIYQQRYLVAIELGKYLLDFLGNEKYSKNSFYHHQYKLDNTLSIDESYRFANAILMPEISFLRQYVIASNKLSYSKYIIRYLSKFFEVTESLVHTRINEIINWYKKSVKV